MFMRLFKPSLSANEAKVVLFLTNAVLQTGFQAYQLTKESAHAQEIIPDSSSTHFKPSKST